MFLNCELAGTELTLKYFPDDPTGVANKGCATWVAQDYANLSTVWRPTLCAGFRVQDPGFWVQGSQVRVHNSGFRVQGVGFAPA